MTIKKATRIALFGNGLVAVNNLLLMFGYGFPPLQRYGQGAYIGPFINVAGPATLVFFLFTLYRKQPKQP